MDKKKILNKILDGLKKNPRLKDKIKERFSKGKNRKKKDNSGPEGLDDKFSLEVEGQLKIEKYDKDGNIIEEHEEENLVVDEAFLIILRSLAHDEPVELFLNPMLRDEAGNRYRVGGEFNDEPPKEGQDYEWELGLEPKPLYECYNNRIGGTSPSYEYYTNKEINSFPNDDGQSYDTVQSIYRRPRKMNTNSVNFIGLGISQLRYVNNDNLMLDYNGEWDHELDEDYRGGLISKTELDGSNIKFETEAEEIKPIYTVHPRGGNVGVYVNGEKVTTLHTYSAEEEKTYSERVDISEVPDRRDSDGEIQSVDVELRFEGSENQDADVAEPMFIFEGIEIEGYTVETSSLAQEVPLEKKRVDVPAYYNTTSHEPYTFFLDLKNHGVNEGNSNKVLLDSIKLKVGPDEYKRVTTPPTPGEKEFYAEENGYIQLPHEARRVAVEYELENEYKTSYKRARVDKLLKEQETYDEAIGFTNDERDANYPIYDFARNRITFEALFDRGNPNCPIIIKEVCLFNMPLKNVFTENVDEHEHFVNEKMFSITDVEEVRKDPDNEIRVIWTIRFNRLID